MREVTMMTKNAVRMAAMGVVLWTSGTALAGVVLKANNTTALDQDASWVDGVVPGASDVATWDSTYTQTGNLTLGSDLAWSGINFVGVPNGFTFNSGNTLSLGADGITTNINKNYTFNNGFALGTAQTWSIGNGITNFGTGSSGIDTNGYSLTFAGGGQKIIKTAITDGGALYFLAGTSKLTSGAVATASAATVGTGATLNFDVNTGTLVRLSSLTLEGRNSVATFSLSGSSGNQVDQISGALTIAPGAGVVTVTAGTGGARIEAGSLARQAGSNVLFRGSSLGSTPGASVGNVMFTSVPLSGSGTSGATIGIIKGAIGDTTTSGSGYTTTGGLVTYDAANGVRLLSGSEYQAGVTNGQGYETTPVYVNSLVENSSGAVNTIQLGSDTAVNSLSLRVTAASSGITLTGDGTTTGTLKINSGVVYAVQSVGSAAANAINIDNPVDLNGQEGVILASTAGISNSVTAGKLEFKNAITNGNGLTKAGPGEVRFSGSAANTYSGTTTVNEGILTISKSAVNSIPGDLVINGGRVQHGSSNQIADTSNITINGGTYSLQYSNSGSVFRETFNNLTMNGGTYVTGTGGHDGVSNILGTMTLNAGALNMSTSDDVNVTGPATYAGGTHSISPSGSTTAYNTLVTLSAGVAIYNTASGAYTPITINGHATNKGGKLILGGNLLFTGNVTNTNTVTIASPAAAISGVIDLNGGSRVFTINDGAATDDLTIAPVIENGSLTKAGAGSLVLGGANTYTGDTVITAGRVALGASGSLASSLVDIKAGATFDVSALSATLTGAQTLKFTVDASGAGSAGLLKAGTLDITGGAIDFATLGTLDDAAYLLATYTSLTGSAFGSVANLPSGYELDYDYLGQNNTIALVTIPEPATLSLAVTLGASLVTMRRRRRD